MNNKKEKVLTIVGIIVLIAMLVGATYAYFIPETTGTSSRSVSATSNTTDNLSFSISNDISFTVTQADFQENGTDKSGYATAQAVLTPNNKTGEASINYDMYLDLTTNGTVYSSTNTNHDAELILQVFNSNNQLVTLSNLGAQVTSDSGVTGYDITGVTGLITLLDSHEISASNNQTTTENWRVVITMINLDVDQNDNTNKTVSGELIIQKESQTQTYATFISGPDFNEYLDNLVDEYNDEHARTFVRSLTIDNQYKNSTYAVSNVTEVTGDEYPIYVWFDSTNNTIYWYSEAEVVYTDEDMTYMFGLLGDMVSFDMTGINTSRTTIMENVFNHMGYSTEGMTYFNLGNDFDTSNVTSMSYMFSDFDLETSNDIYLNLGNKFDTSNVEDMSYMFKHAGHYGRLHINFGSLFDTSNVETFEEMFAFSSVVEISSGAVFDLSSAQNISEMFDGMYEGSEEILTNLIIDFGDSDFTNISNYSRAFRFDLDNIITFVVKDAATQARVIAMDDSNPKKLNTTNVVVRTP